MSIKKILLTTAIAAVFVPHNLSAEDSYFEYMAITFAVFAALFVMASVFQFVINSTN